MANMSQDIQVDLILPGVEALNRKQAFSMLAGEIAADIGYPAKDMLTLLLGRELTSPSAIGDGIAIPHLKLKNINRHYKALALLTEPVDFEATDGKPVDLMCIVISPEQDGPLHLRRLARVSRMLQNRELRARIRTAQDTDSIRSLLATSEEWMMAA